MSAPTADPDEITERVRQAIRDAEAAGERPPGRPTLIKKTGLTEHQVKIALETLRETGAGESPVDSSASPADPDGGPDTVQMPVILVPEPMPAEAAGDILEPLEIQPSPVDLQSSDTGEPDLQPARSRLAAILAGVQWPLVVIGLGAAVAVWSGWVGLGQLTGFGMIQPLPGIIDDLRINTAVVLPLSVEAYAATSLKIWLSSAGLSRPTRLYAMISSISSLVIGAGAQVAYHLMVAAGMTRAPWQITVFVACMPVVVLGLAVSLAHLVSRDLQAGGQR